MLLAIITAWLAYREANNSGRNGILWAIIGAGVFLGTQFIVALAIGAFIGVGIVAFGWPEDAYDAYEIPITIAAIAASIFTSWLLVKYLQRAPREQAPTSVTPPPPPPTFGQGM